MRDRVKKTLILSFLLASLAWGCRRETAAPSGSQSVATSGQSEVTSGPKVVSLGRLEPRSGVVSISALPGERLESLAVKEGDVVIKGQPLGELASFRLRSAEVEALKSQIQVASVRWTHNIEVAKARLIQAQAAVAQAETKQQEVELLHLQLPLMERKRARAKETYARLLNLRSQDPSLATDRELERYELMSDAAVIDHELANERHALARGTAKAAKRVADANVTAAEAVLKEIQASDPVPELEHKLNIAQLTLDRVDLQAPFRGRVLKVFAHHGEVLANQPILQLADLDDMVCIAEVYEADAHKIKAEQTPISGDRAKVISKAFSRRFASEGTDTVGIWGTVEYVGNLVAAPGLQSRNPLTPADRAVVEVRIRLDSDRPTDAQGDSPWASDLRSDAQQAAELVGLKVKVEFYHANQTNDRNGQP